MTKWFAIALACAWLGFAATAQGATRRIALLIGSNEGSRAHQTLRYAEADAAKLSAVLTDLGGVSDEDLLLLRGPSLSAVRAGFREASRRVEETKSAGGRTVLIVFFSGHSDGVALELGEERLTFAELRSFMEETRADVRVAIVDSCRSGALLAAKGGAPGPAFDLRLVEDEGAKGQVLLTSSAANEQALESREIGGSIFTHHFVSGLRGAADASGDGKVTLTEAYEYAFARTVRASADTLAGVQHPSFDYRLSGQGDLVLTETSPRSAVLQLPLGIEHALVIDERRDRVVAEASANSPGIQLAPGIYRVRTMRAGHPAEVKIELAAGEHRTLDANLLQPISLSRATGKGDADFNSREEESSSPANSTEENPSANPPRDGEKNLAVPSTPTPLPRDAITLDPLLLFVQTLSLHYERTLSSHWTATLKLRAGIIPANSPVLQLFGSGAGTTVLGGSIGASYFPGKNATPLDGFFLGPSVDLFRISRNADVGALLVPSVELGYAWLFESGFTFALAGGVQYAAVTGGTLESGDAQLGFFPRFAVRVGYAF